MVQHSLRKTGRRDDPFLGVVNHELMESSQRKGPGPNLIHHFLRVVIQACHEAAGIGPVALAAHSLANCQAEVLACHNPFNRT
jgi:hypothetical protein